MRLKSILYPIQEWIVRHPALFSSFFIYTYYLAITVNFFIGYFKGGKAQALDLWDYVSQFDALPFMWLLAYAFVRLLNQRERTHEEEKKALEQKRELEVQATQIQTLQEVTLTLMDTINNPVAIILMYLRRLKEKLQGNPQTRSDLQTIEDAAQRISKTLKEVSEMDEYKVLEASYGRMLDMQPVKK